jgi:tRNA modification GTPase
MTNKDTICAISSPAGAGGVAVIRISGCEAIAIVDKIFRPNKERKSPATQKSHTLNYGRIMDGESVLDEVLVSVFRAPHSFTGEDVVEVACHGSLYIQQHVMEVLIAHGARVAEAGEFTQRAFLNGKLDLAQAEAVADLIASENETAHRVAMQQMRGGFSDELKQLRDKLLTFVSLMELELDFSEEEVEFADRKHFKELLQEIQTVIGRLIRSFSLGNVIKNGVPVAIVGQTNVGKSTLLNTLLGEERAIVSDIHGTTRDTIEDSIQLDGIAFRFIDTAGIRRTTEAIEQLGIQRTYEKISKVAIILLMVDATRPQTFENIKELRGLLKDHQKLIVAVNKVDTDLTIPNLNVENVQYISAKMKQGINELKDALVQCVNLSLLSSNETIVTNLRHYEALRNTQSALERVFAGLDTGLPGDLIAQDVREALHYLGSITGQIATDEILENIFSKFCIGK